jgi:hypothetical protein
MIGGMVGYKTITSRAIFQQHPYRTKEIRVTTGAEPFKTIFENVVACHIS